MGLLKKTSLPEMGFIEISELIAQHSLSAGHFVVINPVFSVVSLKTKTNCPLARTPTKLLIALYPANPIPAGI